MYSDVSSHCMELIRSGKIRNHILLDNSRSKSSYELLLEAQQFRDFLPSKLSCMLYNLEGSDNCEKIY